MPSPAMLDILYRKEEKVDSCGQGYKDTETAKLRLVGM